MVALSQCVKHRGGVREQLRELRVPAQAHKMCRRPIVGPLATWLFMTLRRWRGGFDRESGDSSYRRR